MNILNFMVPPQVGGCVFQVPSLEHRIFFTPSSVYPVSQSMVATVDWPSVEKLTRPPVGIGNVSQVSRKKKYGLKFKHKNLFLFFSYSFFHTSFKY